MPLVEIVCTTADVITVNLGPEDVLAIKNALNEVCNGIHLDDWDFRLRIGVDRDQAQVLLRTIYDSFVVMEEQRLGKGKQR
ncbi:hypothetical protein [Nonomuraea sp. NEAU-A123]|uniref:hypothetical protein n=1 Tax=Nonomuraea sp. NEAU-A123 TaxID=2839649 RepID=UPI001BE3E522|nr:hypothetical protein [Nonomuraea sp. NEAU-A123]MBT2235139.1 hypothetical protein [Nonomuraea sp. NEAU-A123]